MMIGKFVYLGTIELIHASCFGVLMRIQGTDVEPVLGMQKKYFVKKDYCIEIYIQVCRKEKTTVLRIVSGGRFIVMRNVF